MKIDILQGPPDNIFKDRQKYIIIFVGLLAIACFGLLIGAYTIVTNTPYYEQFEILALVLFVAPSPFAVYFGEKLQEYKRLTPPQKEELAALAEQHSEVETYYNLISKADRYPIRVEYEACQAWAEEVKQQTTLKKKRKK